MTLNITYAKLLPHTEELAELIAHELEVDKNQVRLSLFFLCILEKAPLVESPNRPWNSSCFKVEVPDLND